MRKKINQSTILIVLSAVLLTFIASTILMYANSVELLKQSTISETEYLKALVEMEGTDRLSQVTVDDPFQRVTLVAEDGTVLYDTYADVKQMVNHKNRPEIIQARLTGSGMSIRNSETYDKKVFYYAVRLKNGEILRISHFMSSIFNMMMNMLPYMVVLLIVILGVSVIVIKYMTEKMVRPINEINLNRPLDDVDYEEFLPLLTRMNEQNERIARQMDELKQAEEIRREFSANVSHELKTPLMTISGYAEIISHHMVQPEDIPEFVSRIHQEASRMATLIDDIIKLSRLDEQSEALTFEPVDLYSMTGEIVRTLQIIARKRDITLEMDGDVPAITGVRQVLYEMLYNLCDNAIKYNKEHGWVYVLMTPSPLDGFRVRWSIRDTGVGIPEESKDRIFERFYRVDKSHSRETGGTGLGLAIVKHGAQLHHAEINVDSCLGEGTCISIDFP